MTETDETTGENSLIQRVPWRRLGGVVGLIVLLAVVVPFVVYAVPQVVGADQGYVVLSGSMEPAMSPGDVVIVESVGMAAIQEGDVITYTRGSEETPTTHRVIEVVEEDGDVAFRTQGDANEDPDAQLVTPAQVEGEVLTLGGYLIVIPYIGYVIQFMQTTTGFVALFVVPLVLLIASELWNVVRNSGSDAEAGSDDGSESTSTAPANEADAPAADATTVDAGAEGAADSATDAPAEGAEASDDALTFSALELQLGLAALGAFLAYSIWVAYAAVEIFEAGVIWASGVAAAVAAAFLLFLGLYVNGKRGEAAEAGDEPAKGPPTAADGGETPPDAGVSPESESGEPASTPDGAEADSEEFEWQPNSGEDGPTGDDERHTGGDNDA